MSTAVGTEPDFASRLGPAGRVANDSRLALLQYIQMSNLSRGANGAIPQIPAMSFGTMLHKVLYFNLLCILVSALLLFFVIFFYNVRLYHQQWRPSEILLAFWLLRVVISCLLGIWELRYQALGVVIPKYLKYLKFTYNVATAYWIAAVIRCIILAPKEDFDSFTCRTCFVLLWLTIASHIAPLLVYTFVCLVLYLILVVALYFRNGYRLVECIPSNVLQNLKQVKFKDVKKMYYSTQGSANAGSPGGNVVADSKGVGADGKSGDTDKDVCIQIDDMGESNLPTTGSGVSTAVRGSGAEPLKGSNPASPAAESPTAATPTSVATSTVYEPLVCAVCINEIQDSDKVYILPCDPRHLFHSSCIKTWFKKSRNCPMCRCNIYDLIKAKMQTSRSVSGRSTPRDSL